MKYLYIAGKWTDAADGGTSQTINPYDATVLDTVAEAGAAERVAAALRHGTVWINDYHPYLPQAEWGGFGKSGIGRELGPSGLEEYQEKKHIYHNVSPAPAHWFSG